MCVLVYVCMAKLEWAVGHAFMYFKRLKLHRKVEWTWGRHVRLENFYSDRKETV